MPADETLGDDIPQGVEVHRVAGPEPMPATGRMASANRWLRRPEEWTRWWWNGAKASGAAPAATADLIYVQMQPYDSAEPGAWLSRASGKPWVADLLDPWALDEMMIYPTAFHRRRELTRMRTTLATASAIVMNTPEAAARVRHAFPELREIPLYSISNGFDPRDFEGDSPARRNGVFRIVHTGYLHTELGRQMRNRATVRRLVGGAVPGVDIYTRSHVFLLEAIDRLIAREPALATTIQVHLAGVLSESDKEIASRSPVVKLHGYLDHPETVALQRSADLLFLPMHDLPPGVRTTIIPGKTWEYLASRRPILAAVPDGDARDILDAAQNVLLTRPRDVDAMAKALDGALQRKRAGEHVPGPDPHVVDRFAYPQLTKELATVFDTVLRGADRVSGERTK
jgi:glycosyltransferase involved in cell wall biosynthesis